MPTVAVVRFAFIGVRRLLAYRRPASVPERAHSVPGGAEWATRGQRARFILEAEVALRPETVWLDLLEGPGQRGPRSSRTPFVSGMPASCHQAFNTSTPLEEIALRPIRRMNTCAGESRDNGECAVEAAGR